MTGDPVRDEAERLVAAAIAAVSLAARGLGGVAGSRRPGSAGHGSGFATGSPECCVCPVCRVISAMRDPSPDLAERLASGAGDLASAVAGILRSLSRAGARPNPPERDGDEFWDSLGRRAREEPPARPTGSGWPGEPGGPSEDDDPWRAATRTPPPDDVLGGELSDHDLIDEAVLDGDAPARPAIPPRKMAKKAVKKVAPPPPPPPTTPMAKKAVRKAAPPPPPPPPAEAGPPPPPAKAAKKAAKKAAPPREAQG